MWAATQDEPPGSPGGGDQQSCQGAARGKMVASAPVRRIWVRIFALPPKSCPEPWAGSGAYGRLLPPLSTETCLLCARDSSQREKTVPSLGSERERLIK